MKLLIEMLQGENCATQQEKHYCHLISYYIFSSICHQHSVCMRGRACARLTTTLWPVSNKPYSL